MLSNVERAGRVRSRYPCLNSTRGGTDVGDFDDVLERLLMEPGFRAALTSDPATALRGYDLSADELELLRSQVSGDTGAGSGVETRTSKAGLFGLLQPLVGMGRLV